MVASTAVWEINGAISGTFSILTSARYSLSDSATPGASNPVPIPSVGITYSFWKHHVLNFTGTFTTINNIRWYTDGNIGWTCGTTSGYFGVGIRASGDAGAPVSTGYMRASGNATTGIFLVSGHPYYQGAVTSGKLASAVVYVVGTPLTVDSQSYATSGFSKGVLTQVAIDTTATQGTQAAETVTFRYDEI